MNFRSDMTVELVDSMGSDDSIVRAARVSSGSMSDAEKDKGLINYLMRDRHGSPFEHTAMTFFIEAPIFVFREFQRHRIASYNEESGRYKELKPVFYVPDENRKLIQKGKPGAYTFEQGTEPQSEFTRATLAINAESAFDDYKELLQVGIAREVARMVLPLNIFSSMFVTMNARSLMNFLSLRSLEQGKFPSFPQAEIAQVADGMEKHFANLFPTTHASFIKNGRVAP